MRGERRREVRRGVGTGGAERESMVLIVWHRMVLSGGTWRGVARNVMEW